MHNESRKKFAIALGKNATFVYTRKSPYIIFILFFIFRVKYYFFYIKLFALVLEVIFYEIRVFYIFIF